VATDRVDEVDPKIAASIPVRPLSADVERRMFTRGLLSADVDPFTIRPLKRKVESDVATIGNNESSTTCTFVWVASTAWAGTVNRPVIHTRVMPTKARSVIAGRI
jgi:hypothetical protein